ncbi:hypothetical protein WN944_026290 [Citrus x changshan-huyou]|uniref:Uncharacterized protein n=1 Tax=Citrus x changshan-huyou TaxID=2935761 RepID=A0AAP0QD47_9ROSI
MEKLATYLWNSNIVHTRPSRNSTLTCSKAVQKEDYSWSESAFIQFSLAPIPRPLQRVKSHLKRQIRFCKTHRIWALQPPELVSYVEDLESQLRDIERSVYNIQLELEFFTPVKWRITVLRDNQNALLTIYKAWSKRMRLLMRNNIPADSPTGEELGVSAKKLFICAHTANELLDLLQAYRPETDSRTLVLESPNNDSNSSRSKKYKLDLTLRL